MNKNGGGAGIPVVGDGAGDDLLLRGEFLKAGFVKWGDTIKQAFQIAEDAGREVFGVEEEERERTEKKEPKPKAKKEKEKESTSVGKKSDDLKNMSVDKLNDLLKEAIEHEDYERAAKLRDELGKRN